MSDQQVTIMVVDDNPVNLQLLGEMLLTKDYRVVSFPDGKLALNAAANSPPDLILLDIMMPDMSGYEVCERLKADEALKEIPVLFISALSDITDKVEAFSVGGVDYITKPFQSEEVRARVETHLQIARQKRELLDAYKKLQDLEAMRDGLVHMIVHDMRSPLTVVMGCLELAQMDLQSQDVAKLIDYSINSTRTLIDMIGSILDVSKMEAGQMELELSKVDLKDLVNETIRTIEPIKDNRTITFTPPEDMNALLCDAHLIRRVVQNLLSNALKYTDKETGIISISIKETAENMTRLSVSNNGHGIPLEFQKKVFDKFFQVEAGKRKKKVYSTGLGLTFCKLTVETHGGRIGLDSDMEKGSTFWFELPRC